MIRTYSELQQFDTLEDRYEYLRLNGSVAEATFGFDRWMNQQFYRSREWKDARNEVIARDGDGDLGLPDVPIMRAHYVHHMNPISIRDLEEGTDNLFDPEFLILASHRTHNAIHYGDARQLPRPWVERAPGDTRAY